MSERRMCAWVYVQCLLNKKKLLQLEELHENENERTRTDQREHNNREEKKHMYIYLNIYIRNSVILVIDDHEIEEQKRKKQ